MNSISQFYKKRLKERINSKITEISSNLVDKLVDNLYSTNNNKYFNFINDIQESTMDIIKQIIVETFEAVDKQFRNSKRKFDTINKSNVSRTITTLLGDVTFKRTYYISKVTDDYYFYVDDVFDLPKYDHYDPTVKAITIDKAFTTNHTQAGKDTGEMMCTINKLSSQEVRNKFHISRQSVNNWIKEWNNPTYKFDQVETPDTLYVMADEKFIGCQDLDNDIMVKCMVAFEDIKKIGKNRNALVNRTVISKYTNKPWEEFIDVLSQKYDFSKINNIILMGDGANWIKMGKDELKMENNNVVTFKLCIFHFKQAINRITGDEEKRKLLLKIFNTKSKKEFISEVNNIIESDKNREKNINKNLNYILNNYTSIKTSLESNIGSSMESHISHCIANLFASRPKGYSSKNIDKYLEISNYKNNGINIIDLYSKTYNSDEKITINGNKINYSLFEKKESNIPIIDSGIVTPTFNAINALIH